MAYVPTELADSIAGPYEPSRRAGADREASEGERDGEKHLEVELLGERCAAVVLSALPVKPDHLRRRQWQSPLPPAL